MNPDGHEYSGAFELPTPMLANTLTGEIPESVPWMTR